MNRRARSWRAMATGLVALCAAGTVTACGGGSTDEPGGEDISSGSQHINLVAYAVPKAGFDLIIPAFRGNR